MVNDRRAYNTIRELITMTNEDAPICLFVTHSWTVNHPRDGPCPQTKNISRRDFLKLTLTSLGATFLAACGRALSITVTPLHSGSDIAVVYSRQKQQGANYGA